MQPKVFLSYSWKNKDVADTIDKDWEAVGIPLTRDIRGLEFKQDIKQFMHKVTECDHVILLISKEYLESRNCMYEALEMLNDARFKEKILPILIGDAKIHDPVDRVQYVKHWEQRANALNENIKQLDDLDGTMGLQQDLHQLRRIRQSIDRFTSEIQAILCATWPATKDNNYAELYQHIGFASSEVLEQCNYARNIMDYEQQEIVLETLSIEYPGNSNVLFTRASTCYAIGMVARAHFLFDRLVKQDETFWPAHYYLGVIFACHLGNDAQAEVHYKRALELNPRAEGAHVEYGNLLLGRKDIANAQYHYKQALAIDPHYVVGLANFGLLLHHHLHQYPKARASYERTLELAPDHSQVHVNLGRLLANEFQEYQLALTHLKKGLRDFSNDAELNMNIADLLAKQLNKSGEAVSYYETAKRLNPSLKKSTQLGFWL